MDLLKITVYIAYLKDGITAQKFYDYTEYMQFLNRNEEHIASVETVEEYI